MIVIVISTVAVLLFAIYILDSLLSPKLDLNGSHVVITGGSSGIGKSLAIEVVKQGGSVTIIARKLDILKEAKKEIEQHMKDGGTQKVLALSLDLTTDIRTVEREIHEAEKQLGPVIALVNCAGFSISDDFEKITMEEFQHLMSVNYYASVAATKAVLPGMKARGRGGRVVYTSSQAGQVGIFGFTAYSGAKYALRGLAEALQMEVKPYGIYVTVAFPPDTDTPGYKEEMKRKPKETHLISETSGLFKADDVAKKILKDMQCGRFQSSMGLDGFMLSNLTCGMSPVASLVEFMTQVTVMSIFRLVSVVYLVMFDRIVRKCRQNKDQAKAKQQ